MVTTVLVSYAMVLLFWIVVKRSGAGFVWSLVAIAHLLSVMVDPTLQAVGTGLRLVSWAFVVFHALSFKKPGGVARPRGSAAFLGLLWTLIVLGAASTVWTVDFVDTAAKVASFALMSVALTLTLNRRWSVSIDDVVSDLSAVIITTTFTILLSYVMAALGSVPAIGVGGRYQGLFQNPNTPSAIAAAMLYVSLWIALLQRRARSFLPPLLLVSAVLASSSRGALLACALAGLTVFAIALFKRPRAGRVLLGMVLLAAAAMHEVIIDWLASMERTPGTFTRLATDINSTLNGRELAWQTSLSLFGQQPLGGHGWNATRSLLGDAYASGASQFTMTQAHNSYLEVLVDLGVFGAVILGLALLALIARSVALVPSAWGVSASIVAGLVLSATESMMFGLASVAAVFFWSSAFAAFAPTLTPAPNDGQGAESQRGLNPATAKHPAHIR